MDVQLKKGMLEVCVLKALSYGESYGYKIISDLSPHIEISESTLYPILKRLQASGCLTVDSREHNGRLRKYYNITPLGHEKISEFIESWSQIEKIYDYIAEVEDDTK